jgi:energy-converting hydrogenase Eha subunit G
VELLKIPKRYCMGLIQQAVMVCGFHVVAILANKIFFYAVSLLSFYNHKKQ